MFHTRAGCIHNFTLFPAWIYDVPSVYFIELPVWGEEYTPRRYLVLYRGRQDHYEAVKLYLSCLLYVETVDAADTAPASQQVVYNTHNLLLLPHLRTRMLLTTLCS